MSTLRKLWRNLTVALSFAVASRRKDGGSIAAATPDQDFQPACIEQ
jgi:hypothetical protein